jgi:hypothetical protein
VQVVDRDGQFTDKISVNGMGKSSEVVLTIRDVALEDELEFLCQVNGLSAGNMEGRTMLKVFGKSVMHPLLWPVSWTQI